VVFDSKEAAVWFAVFLVAASTSLARSVADRNRDRGWVLFCRSIASGAIAFGVIGCWVGSDGMPNTSSPFYYIALSAVLGFCQKDLQEYLVKRLVFKVFNLPVGKDNATSNIQGSDSPKNPPMDKT